MRKFLMFISNHPDREAHNGNFSKVTNPVFSNNITSLSVLLPIKRGDALIKIFCDFFTDVFNAIRSGNKQKIISTDVPEKICRISQRFQRLADDNGEMADNLIAFFKAITVIKLLEFNDRYGFEKGDE